MMLTQTPDEVRTHEPERTSWTSKILVPEMWAAIAIAVMWIAVLFIGVYGPNMIFNNSSGYTNIPSVVAVAFFAVLGTVAVARRAFRGTQGP